MTVTTFLVSSTEPPLLRALGISTELPEQYGADVMFTVGGKLIGYQRKTISDLVASVQDERLSKEVAQMRQLDVAVLVVEGVPEWTNDGELVLKWTRWNRVSHTNLLRSVQSKGIMVETSRNLMETAWLIETAAAYWGKLKHSALDTRPGPGGQWGTVSNRDWLKHLLQGFPDVGPGTADRIVEHFGGAPLQWTVTAADLMKVKGIGKKTAEKLIAALTIEAPSEQMLETEQGGES